MIKKFVQQLNNIDPMPWNQAALLAVAFCVMIVISIFGNFFD
jgi:hypothetical protein